MFFDNSEFSKHQCPWVRGARSKLLGVSATYLVVRCNANAIGSRLAVSLADWGQMVAHVKCAEIGSATTTMNIQSVREVLVK